MRYADDGHEPVINAQLTRRLLPLNDLPAPNNGQNVTFLYQFYDKSVHVSVKNV
jgi:hypothetical protein